MFKNFKNIILVDASAEIACAARINDGVFLREEKSETMAMESFTALLKSLAPRPSEIDAFVLCEGPGSILGTRVASLHFSMCAVLSGAKIFSYKALQCAAYALAKQSPQNGDGMEIFSLLAPSRKGFVNILNFENSAPTLEAEITIGDMPQKLLKCVRLLDQRKKVDAALDKFERYSPTMKEIWSVLNSTPSMARLRTEPIDALSLAEREYVKWKAPALI